MDLAEQLQWDAVKFWPPGLNLHELEERRGHTPLVIFVFAISK